MGSGRRALNRSKQKRQTVSNPNFAKKPRPNKFQKTADDNQLDQAIQPSLVLAEADTMEQDSVVPFVIKTLPSRQSDLIKLVKTYGESELNTILCRLRDYHDPLATESQPEPWNKFVLVLLSAWNESSGDSAKVYANHLKEILGQQSDGAQVIIRYVQVQLSKVIELLKTIQTQQHLSFCQVQQDLDSMNSVLNVVAECQNIYIHLFERAQCKLLNVIEQTLGQLYQIIGDMVLATDLEEKLMDIVNSHMNMLKKQAKPLCPSLTYILVKMLKFHSSEIPANLRSLAQKYSTFVTKKAKHSQVLLIEINRLLGSSSQALPLYPLRMRQEKPLPLATYEPRIEDEFLPSKSSQWRREMKNSEKEVKRKTKKLQKEAVRELKKDTQIIQQQRERENEWRKKAAKRTTFKVGEKGVRDEI